MGKHAREEYDAQLRRMREAERLNALEKQKRENRLMWIIVASVVGVILLATGIAVLISNWNTADDASMAPQMSELDFSEKELSEFEETSSTTEYVKLNVSYTDEQGEEQTGDIVIRLYSNVAPISVRNFQKLVGEGFYDGMIFHRVIEDFMIQGGGFDQDGNQDLSAATIKGEFSSNNVENHLEHIRGVVSMARSDNKDSASSQFFIVHETSPHLDGNYAAFGFVVYGMDTVDAIAAQETNSNDQPVETVLIRSAKFVTLK